MQLLKFLYPTSIDDLVNILAEHGPDAKIIAGGTDLFLLIKSGVLQPKVIVDITKIEELNYIKKDKDVIRIGALTTFTDVIESELLQSEVPLLVDAAKTVAAPQIRNVATIAGNLVNASPAADSALPLIALKATLKLRSTEGVRQIPVENFFVFVKKTILKPNEFLEEIIIPRHQNIAGTFIKLGKRNALVLSIVSVAVALRLQNGQINYAGIGLGSVAPTPLRAKKAESLLMNQKPTPDLIENVAITARDEASPISDNRGSAEYRKAMIYELTKVAIEDTLAKLGVDVK